MSHSEVWRDRPVLITGASGLLGGWLTRSLIDARADVICVLRDWAPQSELVRSGSLERVKAIRGDICDLALLERALGEYEINTVFHVAAQAVVGVANRNPISTFETNIAGTWNVLEACRRAPRVSAVVVASSDKAYGEQNALPYSETTPLEGRHPYDVSKACADMIAQSYGASFNLPLAITRCGNLYGGGDLNWNRVVPGTIRSVLRGQRPVIRSDGEFVRDYFYVEDAAAAYLLLAERLLAGDERARGQVFNFSNEIQVTVIELVQMILDKLDSSLEPDIRNEASNEIHRQYLNAAKARTILGWRPLFTLDEGLSRTIAWYRDFFRELTDESADEFSSRKLATAYSRSR